MEKKPAELPKDPTLIEEGVEEPREDHHWAGVEETNPHQGGRSAGKCGIGKGQRSARKGWGRSTPRNFN